MATKVHQHMSEVCNVYNIINSRIFMCTCLFYSDSDISLNLWSNYLHSIHVMSIFLTCRSNFIVPVLNQLKNCGLQLLFKKLSS